MSELPGTPLPEGQVVYGWRRKRPVEAELEPEPAVPVVISREDNYDEHEQGRTYEDEANAERISEAT